MKASTLVKGNFRKWNGATFVPLGDNDTISVAADAKSVTIQLKDYGAPGGGDQVIQVGGSVTDLAGNALRTLTVVGYNDSSYEDSKTDDNFALTEDVIAVKAAKAVSKTRVEVTFDGRLNAVGASDFAVYLDGTATKFDVRVVGHSVNSEGKSVVLFELVGATMNTDTTITSGGNDYAVGLSVKKNEKTRSFLGTPVHTDDYSIADGIAPEIVSAEWDDTIPGEIVLTFSEPLARDSFASSGLNGFSVSSGKLTGLDLDEVDQGKVKLLGSGFRAGITVTYSGNADVTDDKGNKLNAFSKRVVEI